MNRLKRLPLRLLLLTGCLILGVLGLEAIEAHGATPTSLLGETFTSRNVKGSTFSGNCTTDGVARVNFSVSGTAAGPFPGTFTESGSFTTTLGGFVKNFSSTFTITSTAGTATGAGSLAPGNFGRASCRLIGSIEDLIIDDLAITYAANINGTQRDAGTSSITILGLLGSAPPAFSENFDVTGAVHEQCKHGRWRSFGTMFKNQGDCVAFFATHGKNPPSG